MMENEERELSQRLASLSKVQAHVEVQWGTLVTHRSAVAAQGVAKAQGVTHRLCIAD